MRKLRFEHQLVGQRIVYFGFLGEDYLVISTESKEIGIISFDSLEGGSFILDEEKFEEVLISDSFHGYYNILNRLHIAGAVTKEELDERISREESIRKKRTEREDAYAKERRRKQWEELQKEFGEEN